MPDDDDDFLDGTCDLDAEMAPETHDGEETLALVLFASVDFLDPDAVEARRVEWIELAAAARGDPQ